MKQFRFSTKFILAIVLLLATAGCRQKVDWTPPDFEQKPVVNALIRSGDIISVKVSLAVAYKSQTTPEVDNAEVLLYVNNEYAETLEYIGDGFYQSELVAQEEKGYRCEVTIPGYPTASCSTHIPKHQSIVKFEHINKAGVDEEGATHPAVKLTFENVPSKDLYYEIVILLISRDHIYRPELMDAIDPVLLNEGLPITVFSNELIEGNSYTMTINYTTGSASYSDLTGWITKLYPVQVELRTVCYNYYKFIKQQYLYEQSTGEPFLSVGATSNYNLHSNVESGYGIFAGYSSVKSEIIDPNS